MAPAQPHPGWYAVRNQERMEKIGDGIWETSHPLLLGGILELGHRMTVLRSGEGTLLVHSPVRLTATIKGALEALGQPSVFVAPSYLHDMYWHDYFEAYPDATFLAPGGMPVKGPFQPLDEHSIASDDVSLIKLDGMPNVREHLMYHHPSRSLIVADLVFNLDQNTGSLDQLAQRLAGIYGNLGPSRLFRFLIRDRASFSKSLERVFDLDFERIIMGHGKVLEENARNQLHEAYHSRNFI